MSYVLAVVTQFQGSGSDEVIIKARGRAISTAVDTAEIVRNRFIKDAKIKDIKINNHISFLIQSKIDRCAFEFPWEHP